MDRSEKYDIEKYSSAFTLSDMEIFVFPELMYALVLANIAGPVIWQWREADCFKKLEGKSPYKKLMRLKQFIMDEFEFNLDLQTWGLSDKDTELARFEKYIRPEDIAKSNALFGYHGDEYYFDIDIRKHFGLDKFDGNAIPYWKTETVEAMQAFKFKKGYACGAGECVSLSAVYAAAAFIVCRIPLEDICMILTPLHSQNFININGGVITNNRRLVTKTMWFNGTELSNKAQRALRNEQITIIANNTGWIHCLYDKATIDKEQYREFSENLKDFLDYPPEITSLANFLRCHHDCQSYFQFCRDCRGNAQFIEAEVLFHYEHESNFRIADATHEKLLEEVDEEDFSCSQISGRIRCDEFKEFMAEKKPDINTQTGREQLAAFFGSCIPDSAEFVGKLYEFLHIEPDLPGEDKKFEPAGAVEITVDMSREQIVDYLKSIREKNPVADLSFYAGRDMNICRWEPFIKAAIERNPVSIELTRDKTVEQCYNWLAAMENESIYSAGRMALPDEVVNYERGDGLEKAITLANIIRSKLPDIQITVRAENKTALLDAGSAGRFEFFTKHNLAEPLTI